MLITIPHILPSLNEYINADRSNKYAGAKIKKNATELCTWSFLGKSWHGKIHLHFKWYVKNRKKDPDNIAHAKKYILDGMVQAGSIANDGWSQIAGFQDSFFVDKNERVEIEITEG